MFRGASDPHVIVGCWHRAQAQEYEASPLVRLTFSAHMACGLQAQVEGLCPWSNSVSDGHGQFFGCFLFCSGLPVNSREVGWRMNPWFCQFRVRASIPICSSMTESNNGFAGFPIEIAPGLLWTLNSQIAILCWQQRDVPFLWCMENCVLHIVQSPVRLSSSYPGANGSFFHFRGTSTAICLSLSFNDYVELLGGV